MYNIIKIMDYLVLLLEFGFIGVSLYTFVVLFFALRRGLNHLTKYLFHLFGGISGYLISEILLEMAAFNCIRENFYVLWLFICLRMIAFIFVGASLFKIKRVVENEYEVKNGEAKS